MYGRAATIRVCPPCLPKSTAGGGSQRREAFILTVDGRCAAALAGLQATELFRQPLPKLRCHPLPFP